MVTNCIARPKPRSRDATCLWSTIYVHNTRALRGPASVTHVRARIDLAHCINGTRTPPACLDKLSCARARNSMMCIYVCCICRVVRCARARSRAREFKRVCPVSCSLCGALLGVWGQPPPHDHNEQSRELRVAVIPRPTTRRRRRRQHDHHRMAHVHTPSLGIAQSVLSHIARACLPCVRLR